MDRAMSRQTAPATKKVYPPRDTPAVEGPVVRGIERQFVHTFGDEWPRAIGPALIPAANGDLLCAWVAGPQLERDSQPGLSAVYRRSTDGGETWSDLSVWLTGDDPARCTHGHPNYVAADSAIVGFGLTFDALQPRMPRRRPFTVRSHDHGHTWSEREPLHDRVGIVTRAGRVVLHDGTWLFPQHYLRPPDVPLVVLHFPEPVREARDVAGWIWGVNVLVSADQGRMLVPHGYLEEPATIQEPHALQLRDGTVVLLCRVNRDGFLWRAESRDGGRTWSAPRRTEIPNPGSKVWLMRLADERIALIHNPSSTARDPLALWISEDEMRTWPVQVELDAWRHHERWFTRRPNAGTSTALAYPHAVERNGRLRVVYDLGRRDIVQLIVDLAVL